MLLNFNKQYNISIMKNDIVKWSKNNQEIEINYEEWIGVKYK